MIKLHRINGGEIFLNEKLIEIIESTPDTIITLNNGHKYIIREKIESIISLIRQEAKDG
jgi:flagellar protein FlbD